MLNWSQRNFAHVTSRQCNCRDVCKISLWSVKYILNQSTANFGQISNSIEISLVGQAPGQCDGETNSATRSWTDTILTLQDPFLLNTQTAIKFHQMAITHLPLDKMAAFLQTIFSDTFSWMKSSIFWLKFHWSLFLRVQLTISQHWFR